MAISILIADDHEVVRAGLRSLLQGTDIRIVAEADNGTAALKLTLKHKPNLVLLDVRMPEIDGLSCLARIKLDLPNVPVVMFSAYDNPTYVARAVALGAAGYVSKTASKKEIIEAIRAAANGDTIWTREELRRVTGALATPRVGANVEVPLTKRENEVLKQLAFGLTNKEIAQALGISYETVKEHVQHILRKDRRFGPDAGGRLGGAKRTGLVSSLVGVRVLAQKCQIGRQSGGQPPPKPPRKKKRASNEPITFWLDTAVRGKATAVSHSSEAPRASEVSSRRRAVLSQSTFGYCSDLLCRGRANDR